MTDLWAWELPKEGAGPHFPCLLSDETRDLPPGIIDATIQAQRSDIIDLLGRFGAVIFRGLPLRSAEHFDAFIQSFAWPNFRYADSLSNAVRSNRTERVFTANEAPPTVEIFLHHEMAQTPIYPSKLFFFCQSAPETGGETPLCRSDTLLALMREQQPEFVERCAKEGLRYTNVMPQAADAGSGQGRSWRDTLGTDDPKAAEAKLTSLDYAWEWLSRGDLKVTTPVLPAVKTLADGTEVFFNQLIAAYQGWNDNRNEGEKSVRFGSGGEIRADDLAKTCALAATVTENVAWQRGDVVLVDNFKVMHGRRPFSGSRSILASLVGDE